MQPPTLLLPHLRYHRMNAPQERVQLARYCHLPVGNMTGDWILNTADALFARCLRDADHLLWANDPTLPDVAGPANAQVDTSRFLLDQPTMEVLFHLFIRAIFLCSLIEMTPSIFSPEGCKSVVIASTPTLRLVMLSSCTELACSQVISFGVLSTVKMGQSRVGHSQIKGQRASHCNDMLE